MLAQWVQLLSRVAPVAGRPEYVAHYVANKQIGGWDTARKIYQTYDSASRTWGEEIAADNPQAGVAAASLASGNKATGAPIRTPTGATTGSLIMIADVISPVDVVASPSEQPIKFGLQRWDEIGEDGKTQFNIGEKPATEEQVYKALGIGTATSEGIPHKKEKILAYVSDNSSERSAFTRAWESSDDLKPWRDSVQLKVMAPNDPMLKDRDGKSLWYSTPGIYCVAADGKALGTMSLKDYEGPEQLAGALYQIDPTFNPDAVPDLAHPQVDPDATRIRSTCGRSSPGWLASWLHWPRWSVRSAAWCFISKDKAMFPSLMLLTSLLAWADPLPGKGKAAPKLPTVGTGIGWTSTHTWVAVIAVMAVFAVVAVLLLLGMFFWLKSRSMKRDTFRPNVSQGADQVAMTSRRSAQGPPLITDGDRLIQADLERDATLARLKADRQRWAANIDFRPEANTATTSDLN